MALSDYSKTSYVNGGTPAINAINLNNAENKIYELDRSLLPQSMGFNLPIEEHYTRNTKIVADPTQTWTTDGNGTLSDGTNYKVGTKTCKVAEDDNTASYNGAYFDPATAIDLTKFNDGSASTTADYIAIILYVEDKTSADYVYLRLFKENYASKTNFWQYEIDVSTLNNGFNVIKLAKSSFADNGGDWADINCVHWFWHSLANQSGKYFELNYIQMVRKDPSTSALNQFQRNGSRDFAISGGDYFVGIENNSIVCKVISANSDISLIGTKAHTDFIMHLDVKNAGSAASMRIGWRNDADNYVNAFITSDDFYVDRKLAGAQTTLNGDYPVDTNDTLHFEIVKLGQSITASIYKNRDKATIKSYSFDCNFGALSGYIYIILPSTSDGDYIESLSITTTEHAKHATSAELASHVEGETWKKIASETLSVAAASVVLNEGLVGYSKFRLLITAKNDTADSNATLKLNGDTGANYSNGSVRFISSTTYNLGATGVSIFTIGRYGGASDSNWVSTDGGMCELLIDNIAAIRKNIIGRVVVDDELTEVYGNWNNISDLITSITISASSNNFAVGSKFELWGCK